MDSVTEFGSIPFDPKGERRRFADWWADAKAGLDFVAHNLPRAHRFLVRVNPYPKPWRAVTLVMADGARLAAWYGPGAKGAGPAVLLLPGTFQTKDDTPRKRRALNLWRRFEPAHVLIVDQRGFGGSAAHLGTGGSQEALDALAAADWLAHESGVPKVMVWGESLGGAIALLAACQDGAQRRIDSVIAWSPFADLADATRAGASDDKRGQTMLGRTYRWLLRRRDKRVRGFHDLLSLRADELGVPLEELLHGGSPARHLHKLRVPAIVVHAEDDPVVPVTHAQTLKDIGSPKLEVHIVPRGKHLGFDREAPAWFDAVTAHFVRRPR